MAPSQRPNLQRSVILGMLAGQVGCAMPILVVMGVGAGIGLDRLLGTSPIFTLIFIVLSAPMSLFIAVRMLLDGIGRAQAAASESKKEMNS